MSGSKQAVRVVVPATLEALREVSQAIERFVAGISGIADAEIITYNIVLAVHELCTNIVTHGYDGQAGDIAVGLEFTDSPPCLVVSVHDSAPRVFDEAGWQAPNLDEPKEHGLGIWLIKQLMDDVRYQPGAGNNRWQLRKVLPIGRDRQPKRSQAAS